MNVADEVIARLVYIPTRAAPCSGASQPSCKLAEGQRLRELLNDLLGCSTRPISWNQIVTAAIGLALCGGKGKMPASFVNDPNHWRDRAEEMRTIAERMKDQLSKEKFLRIMRDYEKLAEQAEERLDGTSQSKDREDLG